jgi:meso-butanediol dehydrogenase/(S,S)-butanediol dehydrogenase/diacetyl reductase
MTGKVALITGSAGGIGAAAAELFCTHGAKVLLVDRDEAVTKRAEVIRKRVAGAEVDACVADVTDAAQSAKAVKQAVQRFGSLNVLVSNAAIRYLESIEKADTEQWQALLSVNLLGAVNFCKAALPSLRGQPGANIVLLSSTYAVVGRKHFGAYDATKAALLSLTKTLAWEESEHGIRVNAVCPGGTLTPFTVGRGKARGLTEDLMRKEAKADNLLKRWAEEKEIAYPVLWLASDEASYVTGATLMVDGGTSVM